MIRPLRCLMAGLMLSTAVLAAPQGGSFELRDASADAAGDVLSGGAYSLVAVVAQIDADPLHPASGGVYALRGGFLAPLGASTPTGDAVFADGFE
ncbi:MAG: hypothetical protein R3F15_03695 [Lysobacterales bacterium]